MQAAAAASAVVTEWAGNLLLVFKFVQNKCLFFCEFLYRPMAATDFRQIKTKSTFIH